MSAPDTAAAVELYQRLASAPMPWLVGLERELHSTDRRMERLVRRVRHKRLRGRRLGLGAFIVEWTAANGGHS